MLWEIVPLLAEFFADEEPSLPPPLTVSAASQIEVRPTKSIQLKFAVQALSIPAVAGILVTVVATFLKVWLTK
jgi:hypothetical protein